MRFIHCSDTHLERSNFKLEERRKDFFRAFEKVIDTAIERKVGFVVHSGDIFDVGRPSVATMIGCIRQLKRLKENGIPFFTVWGSHDVSISESPVQLLDELGLAVNLADPRYHSGKEKVVLSGEKIGECFICGLPGRRADAKAMYEAVEAKPAGKYNIFVFHHTVSEADTITSDIPISLLPRGFDYYAGGHWHKRCEFRYGKGVVAYPGPTESNTVDEMADEHGFYIVDTSGKTEWVRLKQRETIVKELRVEDSVEDVNRLCVEALPQKGGGEMVIIRLKGRLTTGTKAAIDRQAVETMASGRGLLTARVYTSELENPESRVHVETKKRSLEEIERDFLKLSGYDDRAVELALGLIRVLGGDLAPSEKEKSVKEAERMVEGL